MSKESEFLAELLPLKQKLFRLALRVVQNREEAEDIVEDVMVKA
jgi:RNA polymerase sigma-70 factor (ECF subfamily)